MPLIKETSDPGKASAQRRWTLVLTACLMSFLAGIDATSIISALPEIAERFNIDDSKFRFTYFTVTAWSSGAAIVSLFVLPIMEEFGMRRIYLTLHVLFMLFVMAGGLAPTFVGLVTLRVFARGF